MSTPSAARKPVATDTRDIDLAFDFLDAAITSPDAVGDIPDGVTLVLIPDDNDELASQMIDAGLEAVHRGEDTYFCHVQRLPDGTLMVKRQAESPTPT